MISFPPINPNNFLLKEIPRFSPFSPKRNLFWQGQLKKVIEGAWHSGRWMPGKLYFYSNFATIRLNKGNSKYKVYDRPNLRDIEWIVFYAWEEARGFSGFEDDPEYSCDERLLDPSFTTHNAPKELLTPSGNLKKYETVREYLYKTHKENYGRPLYNNQAKNFMMMGPRTYGKALDPKTRIIKYPYKPTPIREIQIGDIVLARDGTPTTVTGKTPVMDDLRMYTVKIGKKRIYACEDHQWVVLNVKTGEEEVRTTKELVRGTWRVPVIDIVKFGKWDNIRDPLDLFIMHEMYPRVLSYSREEHRALVNGSLGKRKSPNITEEKFHRIKYEACNIFYSRHMDFLTSVKLDEFLNCKLNDRKKIQEYMEKYGLHKKAKYLEFYRKLRQINTGYRKYRKINSVTPYPSKKKGICITVSHPSSTYILEDNIVTHNSYMMGGGVIAHEFLFDGRTKYDPEEFAKNPSSTNIYVTAEVAKYTNDLLTKTKMTFDHLPGGIEAGGIYYPPPFSKKAKGSLMSGGDYKAEYRVKIGNNWVDKGTRTMIKNRSAKDNPYVLQGGRASIALVEEVGMCSNAREIFAHTEDVLQDGPSNKYGVFAMIGTGGDMGRGTLDAYYMFYHPDEFRIVKYDDIWEHKGDIGLFIPAEYGNNKFKDKWGFTKFKQAHEEEKKNRASRADNPENLNHYIVYHPQIPSEIFLTSKGSLLPSVELKNRKAEYQKNEELYRLNEKICELYFDPKAKCGVSYKVITDGSKKPIREFPYRGTDREGALVIYELPIFEKGKAPDGLYIIGHDPVGDDSETGKSLAAIYVMKTRLDPLKYGHNEIVAQYVGRPYAGRRETNELLLKLAMFYNAKVWFENNRGNVKEYFEKHKKLHYLAKHPIYTLSNKAAHAQMKGERAIYGFSISSRKDKVDAAHYLREWLLEERGTDSEGNIVRNLDLLPDPALIDECTYYDLDGNFDRVSALVGCVLGIEEQFNKYMEDMKLITRKRENDVEEFFAKQIFNDNHDYLISETETLL